MRALAIALDEVGAGSRWWPGSTPTARQEAVELARDARTLGAAGVLVFPPTLFMWGAQHKPDMVLRHFSEIAAGADLPIVVFEYPPASGIGYAPETLARLAEIPQSGRGQGLVERHRRLRERTSGRCEPPAGPWRALVVHDVA